MTFENLLNIKHIGLWELDLSDNTLFRTLADARIFGYDSTEKNWRYETFLGHGICQQRCRIILKKIIRLYPGSESLHGELSNA